MRWLPGVVELRALFRGAEEGIRRKHTFYD